jgi:hypothetical protein
MKFEIFYLFVFYSLIFLPNVYQCSAHARHALQSLVHATHNSTCLPCSANKGEEV